MITPRTLAHAWLLLAALALTTAGCSQLEDTPDAPSVATGNEPISISIAPKPGFEAGDAATRSIIQAEAQTRSNDAQTRSTVDDATGTFAWEATDKVYVLLTFNFADGTTAPLVKEQRWAKSDSPNTNTPVAGWNVYEGWDASALVSTPITWPLGASKCQVQAFYTNCGYSVASDKNSLTDFTYANSGQGDHMIFDKTFNVGETLAVNFAHSTTRVTFKGLKPLTTYNLTPNNETELLLPTSFAKNTFSFDDDGPQPFTTDKNGTFTRCLPLTSHIDPTTGEVKINVFAADGTTHISEGALKAKGSTPAWKTNGLQYIMTAKDFAGDMNPDTNPDLVTPDPIQPGATVYNLNGYYITQPDANPNRTYQWYTSNISVTEMIYDPCKGKGEWRLPTMKDFEVILGWTTTHPFPTTGTAKIGSNADTFNAAFPAYESAACYWSSTWAVNGTTHDIAGAAWAVRRETNDDTLLKYGNYYNANQFCIRCVQKQ